MSKRKKRLWVALAVLYVVFMLYWIGLLTLGIISVTQIDFNAIDVELRVAAYAAATGLFSVFATSIWFTFETLRKFAVLLKANITGKGERKTTEQDAGGSNPSRHTFKTRAPLTKSEAFFF
jgi:hypothetical protein